MRAGTGRVDDRDRESQVVRIESHEAFPEERQEPAPLGPVHLVEQRHLVELGQEGDVALDGVAVVEHRS